MFGKIRKLLDRGPRLTAATPEERIAAIDKLAADDQEALGQLFLNDADRAVRLAALARLTALEPLGAGLEDAALGSAVAERLVAVLDGDAPTKLREHPLVCRATLASAAEPDQAVAAAGFVSPVAERATALAENPRPEVRLTVAQTAWQPEYLAALERAMRGHDKSVHRLAKERLASLKTASQAREQEDAHTAQLIAAAAGLDDDDPHYDARRDAIERDWERHLEQLAATDAALAPFGVAARDLTVTRQRLAGRRRPPKPVPATAGEDFEPMVAAAEVHCESARANCAGEDGAPPLAELRQAAEALQTRWSAAADAQPPAEEASQRFRSLMATAAKQMRLAERAAALAEPTAALLGTDVPALEDGAADAVANAHKVICRLAKNADKLLQRYDWPEEQPPPAALAALRLRRGELDAAAAECAKRFAASAEQVAADVAALRSSIDAGAVHDAVALERKLRDRVKALPPATARPFNAELAEVAARVRELRDWRDFAELPRREALCEQMETLAEAPLAVPEQAEAVKGLRQQWNDLGVADTRKVWQLKKRFDKAAEVAFQPCRDHFKEQAAQRTFNLEQRQAIVSALESYLADNDWQNADWHGVEQVLRQARAEWRQYHPVDHKAGRALSNRFEAVASEIHGLIKAERERNIEHKEALVAEAVAVRESGRTATDKANAMKALQQRWKSVGPTPHKVGQRLWKQFRAECDVVFEARNTVREQRNDRQRGIEEAETLLDELERRADIDPNLDRAAVENCRQRLDEFERLPHELKRRAASVLEYAERALLARRQSE